MTKVSLKGNNFQPKLIDCVTLNHLKILQATAGLLPKNIKLPMPIKEFALSCPDNNRDFGCPSVEVYEFCNKNLRGFSADAV